MSSISFAEMVWHKEYVDNGDWNNIVLDNNCVPHISYHSNTQLKYATKIGTNWVIEIVDAGDYNSIKLDGEGKPHISYYSTNGDLKYAKKDSVWVIEKVDTAGNVGLYSSLCLDSQYYPCIAYYDYSKKALKYAKKESGNWQIQIVDTASEEISFSSLILDEYDTPSIAYIFKPNVGSPILKYAHFDGSNWQIEIADSGISSCYAMGEVTLALDDSNKPYISYSGLSGTQDGFLRCLVQDISTWECILERTSPMSSAFFPNSITLERVNDTLVFHTIYSATYYNNQPPPCTDYITKRINPPGGWEVGTIDSSSALPIFPRCLVVDSLGRPHFTVGGVYYWYGEYVGIEEKASDFKRKPILEQNYPNPFNSSTIIRFQIPDSRKRKSEARIQIYDIGGRVVRTFNNLSNQSLNQITWDGEDETGKKVKKGVYFYQLEVDNLSSQIKKIVYLH